MMIMIMMMMIMKMMILIIIIIIIINPLLTYSKQIAIYKSKVKKRNIKAYLQFISTNNSTLQGYLQVKSFNFKISRLKENVLRKV